MPRCLVVQIFRMIECQCDITDLRDRIMQWVHIKTFTINTYAQVPFSYALSVCNARCNKYLFIWTKHLPFLDICYFGSAILLGMFLSWTFWYNIELNMLSPDSFNSNLYSQLGYTTGEVQALQLNTLVVFSDVNQPLASSMLCFWNVVLNNNWVISVAWYKLNSFSLVFVFAQTFIYIYRTI